MADGTIVIDTQINQTGAEQGVNQLQSTLGSVSSKMAGIGKVLTASVTLPLVGMGIASAKVAMDFDAQMSRVGAIAGATGDEFGKLRDLALELGSSTSKSASEVAIGMENMAAMGFSVNEVMGAMPGVISAAEASGADMAQTADVMAAALNIFGLEATEATRVADILAMTANQSAADITDMQYALKYAGPSAAALGVSIEELAASVGIMSDAGISGEQAGTVLRAAMSRLSDPTKEAQEAMDQLGLTVVDQNGKFVGMHSLVEQLSGGMKEMTGTQKLATLSQIFGMEAASGMLSVIEAGPDKLAEFTSALENSEGASAKTAAVMKDNLAGVVDELGGAFETAAITIGTIMTPALSSLAGKIQGLVQKFLDAPESVQKIIIVLGMFAAAIGPLILGIAGIASGIAGFIALAGFLSVSVGALVAIFGGIIAVVAAVVAAGILLYQNWDVVKAKAQSVFSSFGPLLDVMKGAFAGLVASLTPIWESLKQLFASLKPVLILVAGLIGGVLVTAFGLAVAIFTGVVSAIGPLVNAFINLVTVVSSVVSAILMLLTGDFQGALDYWNMAVEASVNVFKSLWGSIVGFVSGFVNAIIQFFYNLYIVLVGNSIIPDMVEAIVMWFQNMVTWIVTLVSGFVSVIIAIWNAILTATMAVFSALWTGIQAVWAGIIAGITVAVNAIRMVITTVFNAVKAFIMVVFASIQAGASVVWNGIKTVITTVVNGIRTVITTVFNAIKNAITVTFNAIRATASSVWNAIKSVITTVLNAIRSTVTSIFNSIKSTITSAFNAIKSAISSAINAVKSTITNGFNAAKSAATSAVNSMKSSISSAFSAMRSSISSAISGIKTTISTGFQAALRIVTNMGSQFRAAGAKIVSMLADGISSAVGKVTGAISNVVGKVRDFLPFSPAKVGPLDDIDHLNFDGPMVKSINRGKPAIQSAMADMLQMPKINHSVAIAGHGGLVKAMSQSPNSNTSNSYDQRNVSITVDASNLEELQNVLNLFGGLRQTVRSGG